MNLTESSSVVNPAQVAAVAQSLGYMDAAAVAQAIAQAVAPYQTAQQVTAAVQNQAPAAVAPQTSPLFRVESGPSLLTVLNGIAWVQRVDRAGGTQISGSLTLTALSLGTLTLLVKVNGTTVQTVTISSAQANVERTFTVAQALSQGDVLRIDVSGLGTTPGYLFGYLKGV